MRVLFVEPPKDVWFLFGEYVSPPLGVLALASYLRTQDRDIEVGVVDCQAEELDWAGLEKQIASFDPDVVAPSGLATCNAHSVLRTAEVAKKVDPDLVTVVGGQHFTALAEETLAASPDVDVVVRGEGEKTLVELISALKKKTPLAGIGGLSFRSDGKVVHNPARPLMEDLDSLPFPAYDLVEKHMGQYHFSLMAERDTPFAIVEGARGCSHDCSYCSQWAFWRRTHRKKSPRRIADELQHLHNTYGTGLFWLSDDNLNPSEDTSALCDEIAERGLSRKISWFCQARCDDLVRHKDLLPKMRRAGNIWILVGFDSPNPGTLEEYRRSGIDKSYAKEAVRLLRQNGILSQGTFIIGERRDSHESIETLREYADWLDPDMATFMTLTPFPGTVTYERAKQNGWIEDRNWSNYDMIHAVMPTEHLTREEVQEELYKSYRSYFGQWKRRYKGMFSENPITRRTYQYLAREALLTGLRNLF